MIITYPSHHSWYKNAKIDSLLHYGKSDQKRLRKTEQQAESCGIKVEFCKAEQSFLDWFKPFYENSIFQKRNALVGDLEELLQQQTTTTVQYYTLTLSEKGERIGGCIFADYGWYYSIAYRVFKNSWNTAKLPASPAFYCEYLLDQRTYELGKKMLTHGRDRNPYGLNSSIGLGIFKLAVGCRARTALTHETREIDTDSVQEDCLILHNPTSGRKITEATLICTNESKNKYIQLFNYPKRLLIHELIRDVL